VNCCILELKNTYVKWKLQVILSGKGGGRNECTYSGSGKTPLLCASAAFLALAIAMVIEHTYLLIVVSKATPPHILYWDPHSDSLNTLVWQAEGFFCCCGDIVTNRAKCRVWTSKKLGNSKGKLFSSRTRIILSCWSFWSTEY